MSLADDILAKKPRPARRKFKRGAWTEAVLAVAALCSVRNFSISEATRLTLKEMGLNPYDPGDFEALRAAYYRHNKIS